MCLCDPRHHREFTAPFDGGGEVSFWSRYSAEVDVYKQQKKLGSFPMQDWSFHP
jgi:hypothetical protein